MAFLAKLRLGNGTLKPKLRAALESEGLVLIEEGLGGSVRYQRFRAPGRRHHGKVTGERIGLASARSASSSTAAPAAPSSSTRRSRIRA